MTTADPTPAELMRLLERIDKAQTEMRQEFNAKLDKLVTTDTLARETARIDRDITVTNQNVADMRADLARSLADERAAREKGDAAAMKANEDTEQKRVNNQRFSITTALALAAVLVVILVPLILGKGAA